MGKRIWWVVRRTYWEEWNNKLLNKNMNKKQFLGAALAVLVSSTLSFGQTTSTKCTAMTKKNVQCKNVVKNKSKLCYLHDPNYVKSSKNATVVCTGTTKSGNKCKNKTKNSNKLCHLHTKKD